MHGNDRTTLKSLLVIALIAVIGAFPVAATAQPAPKPIRIGLLVAASYDQRGGLELALTRGLSARGYVEGKNLIIERRYADGAKVQLPVYASQLAGMGLDAIVTTCSDSTRSASNATSSTPIVMAAVADPVGQGFIASLAKPGRNVTGLSSQADELLPKRLEFVVSIVAKPGPIAVLANSDNPVHRLIWEKLETAARQLGLKVVRIEAARGTDIPAAFDAAVRAQATILFLLPDDPMLFNNRRRIVDLAAKHHMPDFYWASEFVEAGGLMSYGENMRATYFDAASYIDKLAHGSKPDSLPVSQPTRFEMAVNLATAKTLGLTIPQSVLLRADEMVQ